MKRYIKCYKLQPIKVKKYHIIDLDCDITVEETTRKEVLSWLDEFIENLQYDWFVSDDTYMILYSDGKEEYISQDNYDGHSVRRIGILSMVYSNPEDSVVFGPYAINDAGVVTTSAYMDIDPNIVEVK